MRMKAIAAVVLAGLLVLAGCVSTPERRAGMVRGARSDAQRRLVSRSPRSAAHDLDANTNAGHWRRVQTRVGCGRRGRESAPARPARRAGRSRAFLDEARAALEATRLVARTLSATADAVRIPQDPPAAALRVRGGQPAEGAPARQGRRHHRFRHGQSRPAGAAAHRREAVRDGARSRAPIAIPRRAASRACAARWPAITTAASA